MAVVGIASYVALVLSLGSLAVAVLAYVISRPRTWAQILFRIVDRLETKEMRDIRHGVVYQYPKEEVPGWAASGKSEEETLAAINRWGAEMDLLALLFFTRQLDRVRFFEFYGDVLIRSAYKLAPHANRERLIRGEQFWLPFQQMTVELLRHWRRLARRRKYPERIGIPGSGEPMTLGDLKNDPEFRRFLQANGQRLPDLA